ncbi:hypothetical protein [Marinobacter salinexigens]|nr:hypothetical protein [Marinobacter salinexigens]
MRIFRTGKVGSTGIALLFFSISLTACMPGTIETAVGTGIILEQESKYDHQHKVERAVDLYIADHADSPCTSGEDRVLDSAVEIIKDYRLSGFDEVMERLEAIYRDETQADSVRAAALYNMAVLHSRNEPPNKARAREYFKRLYIEFPDHYRCIFEESEWRDSMIRKQLLLPGETVESFLEDAEQDIGRRQAPKE